MVDKVSPPNSHPAHTATHCITNGQQVRQGISGSQVTSNMVDSENFWELLDQLESSTDNNIKLAEKMII
eukprot:11383799-Ditylum_brightwellii.AAC.1